MPGALVICTPLKGMPLVTGTQMPDARWVVICSTQFVAAAGQPYSVKLGIGEAVHNRGTLKGVYGFHAAHNASEPAWVWRDARRATRVDTIRRHQPGAWRYEFRKPVRRRQRHVRRIRLTEHAWFRKFFRSSLYCGTAL